MKAKINEEKFNKALLELDFEIEKMEVFIHHCRGPLSARRFRTLEFELAMIEGFIHSGRSLCCCLMSIEKKGG